MLLQIPFPELVRGPGRECRKAPVLTPIQQETLQTSQHMSGDSVLPGHPPVDRRTLTGQVIRDPGSPERPLHQEQRFDVLGDEFGVRERERERVAGTATVADDHQLLRSISGDLPNFRANGVSVAGNRLVGAGINEVDRPSRHAPGAKLFGIL